MRSPLWFIVAAVIGVGGLVAAGLYMFSGLGALEGLMKQVVMPSSVTVDLRETGMYMIHYQRQIGVDGRNYPSNGMAGLRLSVFAADGTELNLKTNPGATFIFGGREEFSFYTFEVRTPGRHRITGVMPDGRTEPKIVLTLGPGFPASVFKRLTLSLSMATGGLAVGALIVIVTIIGRGKARRASAVN